MMVDCEERNFQVGRGGAKGNRRLDITKIGGRFLFPHLLDDTQIGRLLMAGKKSDD